MVEDIQSIEAQTELPASGEHPETMDEEIASIAMRVPLTEAVRVEPISTATRTRYRKPKVIQDEDQELRRLTKNLDEMIGGSGIVDGNTSKSRHGARKRRR